MKGKVKVTPHDQRHASLCMEVPARFDMRDEYTYKDDGHGNEVKDEFFASVAYLRPFIDGWEFGEIEFFPSLKFTVVNGAIFASGFVQVPSIAFSPDPKSYALADLVFWPDK